MNRVQEPPPAKQPPPTKKSSLFRRPPPVQRRLFSRRALPTILEEEVPHTTLSNSIQITGPASEIARLLQPPMSGPPIGGGDFGGTEWSAITQAVRPQDSVSAVGVGSEYVNDLDGDNMSTVR